MKKKILLTVLLLVLVASVLAACSGNDITPTGIKVTFCLEGGTYSNSKKDVEYYYNFSDGAKLLVQQPGSYGTSKKTVTRSGYNLVGWFEKNGDSYGKQWDFAKDEIAADGSTKLYAKWERKKTYAYDLFVYDSESGTITDEKIGTVKVDENGKLTAKNSVLENYVRRNDVTLLNFVTSDGTKVGRDGSGITAPSGENTTVTVYCEFIQGRYTLVSTADEFKTAFGKSNIYLLNDLDFGTEYVSFTSEAEDIVIKGNGHKVDNLNVVVKANFLGNLDCDIADINDEDSTAGYVAMFASMKNCDISDITFDNVTFVSHTDFVGEGGIYQIGAAPGSKVYFAALCGKATDCTFSNVTINASATFQSIEESQITTAEAGSLYVLADGETTATNCNGSVTGFYEKGE